MCSRHSVLWWDFHLHQIKREVNLQNPKVPIFLKPRLGSCHNLKSVSRIVLFLEKELCLFLHWKKDKEIYLWFLDIGSCLLALWHCEEASIATKYHTTAASKKCILSSYILSSSKDLFFCLNKNKKVELTVAKHLHLLYTLALLTKSRIKKICFIPLFLNIYTCCILWRCWQILASKRFALYHCS